jgi:Arc/MetJ-type ribon-helix-helix transcriptional regulator
MTVYTKLDRALLNSYFLHTILKKYDKSMSIGRSKMTMAKIAVSIDDKQLKKIDFYVKNKVFKNRSQAFQQSINETLEHLEHGRLAKECAKLDAHFEQEMADLGLDEDMDEWPKY